MLRLAHRILCQQTQIPNIVDPRGRIAYTGYYRHCQMLLGSSACQVIVADNVAAYYADTPRQEWGLTGKNYPCIAPPFKTAWFVEWREPDHLVLPGGVIRHVEHKGQAGTLFVNMPMEMAKVLCQNYGCDPKTLPLEEARWFLFVTAFMATEQGRLGMVPFMQGIFVAPSGELIKVVLLSNCINPAAELLQKIIATADLYLHIPLLTVGFLHCQNVNRLDVTNEEGPTPKWCRRLRVPQLQYHTIQIDPNLTAKPRTRERKSRRRPLRQSAPYLPRAFLAICR